MIDYQILFLADVEAEDVDLGITEQTDLALDVDGDQVDLDRRPGCRRRRGRRGCATGQGQRQGGAQARARGNGKIHRIVVV